MIIKSFEANKIKINENKLVLLHGKNEGFKSEITNSILREKKEIKRYEEKEILDNLEAFMESIISQSLFEIEKIIVIKRVTDKSLKVVKEISSKNVRDIIVTLIYQ